jgi:excisionase family DNA binding protein
MPAADARLTFTVAEAAERLGVNHQTLRAAIRRGEVPAIRLGRRRVVIPRLWVERVLAAEPAKPSSVAPRGAE